MAEQQSTQALSTCLSTDTGASLRTIKGEFLLEPVRERFAGDAGSSTPLPLGCAEEESDEGCSGDEDNEEVREAVDTAAGGSAYETTG